MASSNTVPSSVHVKVSFGDRVIEFGPHDLEIKTQKSGRLEISGKLERPLEHGFVRISVTAHSKPTCEKTDGFFSQNSLITDLSSNTGPELATLQALIHLGRVKETVYY